MINKENPKNPRPSASVRSLKTTDAIDPAIWRVAGVVFLGPLMAQMDSTVVNVSLSSIRQELHASLASAQWIMSGYLLALALMLPLNGWLVDRLGAKRLYLLCFSLFTLASLSCGTSSTMNGLILARIIQGMAGGLLAPMTQLMIARVAGHHMPRVMGYTSIPVLIAPILGPILAGAILKYATWPWLFFINLPFGVLAITLAAWLLPSDAPPLKKRPFDMIGFLLISPGLTCVLYGLEQLTHQNETLVLMIGLSLVSLFILHAIKRKQSALIDLEFFRNPIFTTAALTQFFSNGAIFGGQFIIPLYLIMGCGYSAASAGWMLAPMGLGMLCTFPSLGFLTERFGCRAVSASGALLVILGTLPFLWMIHNRFIPELMVVSLFVRGIGQGGIGVPSVSAAYGSVAKEKLAGATTALTIVQRLGGPMATTVLAIALSYATRTNASSPQTTNFLLPFSLLVAIQSLVLIVAFRLPILVYQKHETGLAEHTGLSE